MKHALMSKSNGFRGNRNRAPTVLKQGKTQSPTGRAGLLRAVHGILRPDSCLSGDGFGLLPTWENRYFFVQGPKTKSFRLHGRRQSPSRPATRLWCGRCGLCCSSGRATGQNSEMWRSIHQHLHPLKTSNLVEYQRKVTKVSMQDFVTTQVLLSSGIPG